MRAQPKLTKPLNPEKPDKSGWTLGHAGRQVRVGPVAFWTIVGSLVIMAGYDDWDITAGIDAVQRIDVVPRILDVRCGVTGMAFAAMARLFMPFARGAVRPILQGLGLGRYIASGIPRAHGGTLDVVSSAAETCFTLSMPLRG